jgi:DNA polymerase III alpha subunit
MLATFDADHARRANEGGADGSPALFLLERWRTPDPAPALDSFSAARTIEIERSLLGFPIACHPLSPVLGKMRRAGIVTANAIARHVGKRVRVAGLASARRTVETKKGEPMLFLTLEDPTGLVECTFFPGAYARCARAARGGGVLVAAGRVEDHLGAITITADALEPAHGAPFGASSFDGGSSLDDAAFGESTRDARANFPECEHASWESEDVYSSGSESDALGNWEETFTIEMGVPAFDAPHCA